MKVYALVGCCLLLGTAMAQETPSSILASLPQLPPPPPAGVNPAAYPAPRTDWLYQVRDNIQNGKQAASTAQVIFDGDSITASWRRGGKKIWEQRYNKYGAVDFGIGGDRVENLLWRLSQGQAEGMHPKLIVLLIGINNTGLNTADQISEGITAVVHAYQKRLPDSVILLQGIFPSGEHPETATRKKIKQINSTISKLADGNKVIYLDFGDKFLQPDGKLSTDVCFDFVHPTEKGYQIWADAIQPVIDKYLSQEAKVK